MVLLTCVPRAGLHSLKGEAVFCSPLTTRISITHHCEANCAWAGMSQFTPPWEQSSGSSRWLGQGVGGASCLPTVRENPRGSRCAHWSRVDSRLLHAPCKGQGQSAGLWDVYLHIPLGGGRLSYFLAQAWWARVNTW